MRLTILLSATPLIISSLHAQEPCKAKVKSNRNLTVTIEKPVLVSRSWKYDEKERIVTVYPKKDHDSISVSYNGKQATLIAKDKAIISKVYAEYYADGKLQQVDTFGNTSQRPFYFGMYRAGIASRHQYNPDGSLHSVMYYDTTGRISLHKEWYENGQLRVHMDRKQETWYRMDGRISSFTNKITHEDLQYSESGSLRHRSVDTIVQHVPLKFKTWYYDNGKPEKEQWYLHDGDEYGQWKWYNEAGKVTEQRQFDTKYYPDRPYTEPAFSSIDINETASYTNKIQSFEDYMIKGLEPIICETRSILSGTYTIQFQIAESGKPQLISITGSNSGAIEPALKELFSAMPNWKRGEVNSNKTTEVYAIRMNMVKRSKE